jgi:hypothetical protein
MKDLRDQPVHKIKNSHTDTNSANNYASETVWKFTSIPKTPLSSLRNNFKRKRPIQYHRPVVKPVTLHSETFGRQNTAKHTLKYTPLQQIQGR